MHGMRRIPASLLTGACEARHYEGRKMNMREIRNSNFTRKRRN